MAEGILALLDKWLYSEKLIDTILLLINDSVKKSISKKHKDVFKKTAQIIKKIKEKEELEKGEENVDSILSDI